MDQVIVIARYLGPKGKFLVFDKVMGHVETESLQAAPEDRGVRQPVLPVLPDAQRDPAKDKA